MWFIENWGKMAMIENLKHENKCLKEALEKIKELSTYTVSSGAGRIQEDSTMLVLIWREAEKALGDKNGILE